MRVLRLLSVVVGLLLIAVAGRSENLPPDKDLLQKIEGNWGLKDPQSPNSCAGNPHKIAISADKKSAVFTFSKPIESANGGVTAKSSYSILYAEGNKVTMLLDGETRRTEQGDRVIWVLILKDGNTYAWRRTDWNATAATKDMERCSSAR